MADSFKFELVSPERLLVSRDVQSVVVPGTEGEMTVMAHHAPVMSTLRAGVVVVTPADGPEERYVVFGGFADILPDSCTLLAESAVGAAELDREELARRIEAARAELEQADSDHARTRLEMLLHELITLNQVVMPA